MNFKQTDLNFMNKQGRVLSPLEPSAYLGEASDSVLDQSSMDQLAILKNTISAGKVDANLRSLKKGVNMLARFIWKR